MKKIGIFVLISCFTLLFSSVVFATTTFNEVEPNNSSNEAQIIQKNNGDPAKFVTGNTEGQSNTIGNISDIQDNDWYKVYLPVNSTTVLTVNSPSLSGTGVFDVYDENLNIVSKISHNNMGITPYYINISTAGYYYVRVSSSLLVGDYLFTIGDPCYNVNYYVYKAPSACIITPTIKSVQATYDLRNLTTIPNEAIVYKVSISGAKINSASSQYRSIKLESDSSWTSTAMYSYGADIPVISHKLLKSRWMFKLDGNVSSSLYTNFSLIPEIRFSYVYPQLPQ